MLSQNTHQAPLFVTHHVTHRQRGVVSVPFSDDKLTERHQLADESGREGARSGDEALSSVKRSGGEP